MNYQTLVSEEVNELVLLQVFEGEYVRTVSGGTKPIEFLGELGIREKQQLNEIQKVTMRVSQQHQQQQQQQQ